MKKFFLLVAAVTIALSGCAKLEESIESIENRVDVLENTTIPSIEEQIETLNLVTAELEKVDDELQKALNALKSDVQTNAKDIDALEAQAKALDTRITALNDYVDSEIKKAKDAAAAAYATIDALNSAKSELNALQTTVANLSAELNTKIDTAVSSLSSQIDQAVKTLNDKIADLEARLEVVEGKVENLLSRIQSVSYLPEYEDGKVEITRMSSTSWGELSFRISPKDAVTELANVWQSALSCEAYYPKTRTVSLVKLAVTECVADAESGVITVKISGEGLSDEFFAGTQEAKVALVISDGNNQVVSDYADAVGKEITDEIWYTTANGNIVEPRASSFGVKVISNTYENGKGIIKFDGPVTMIGTHGIRDIENLTSVILPNSVTELGYRALHDNEQLTSVDLGLNVEILGDECFRSTIIESLTLPSKLKSIGVGILEFTKVTEITIPESVETIADGAFRLCPNLNAFYGKYASADGKSLIVNGRLVAIAPKGLTEYVVSAEVISVGESVITSNVYHKNTIASFRGNFVSEDGLMLICDGVLCGIAVGGVRDLVIPEGVTKISNVISYGNSNINSLVIPDSVTEIGYSFPYCSNLQSVVIGSGVDKIDKSFNLCNGLSSVVIKAVTPPVIEDITFDKEEGYTPATIYVPAQSVEAYKTAENWSKYADNIVAGDF